MRSLMPTILPSISSPVRPETVRDLGLSLPNRDDIAGLWLERNNLEESIGISIADKASVRAEIWALLFDENDDPYSDEQRIINIEASIYLNCGWELVGNSTKGYALYAVGSAMEKPYRYFLQQYTPVVFTRYLNTNHYSQVGNYI